MYAQISKYYWPAPSCCHDVIVIGIVVKPESKAPTENQKSP